MSSSHQGSIAKGPSLSPGLLLNNKWEIVRHIASGGKGEVYLAHQINLQRNVAVKIISPEFVASLDGNAGELSAEMERFRREVQVMASIRHPNVLQVFDYDTAEIEGSLVEYLVMEYIPGQTLKNTIPEEGFNCDQEGLSLWLRRYFIPVLSGVEAIHSAGVIHRDIKPANVLLDGETPKIADFGLARDGQHHDLTRSHHILGTIFYMPPEQFEDGATADARADVYALGKILYESVEGRGKNAARVAMKAVCLSNMESPFFKELDSILREATCEDVAQRLPSVSVFRERLESALSTLAPKESVEFSMARKKRKQILAAFLLILIVSLVALAYFTGVKENTATIRQHAAERNASQALLTGLPQEDLSGMPTEIQGRDGSLLHIVPGGEEQGADASGTLADKVPVKTFYMDETKITNVQYVAFLNAVMPGVTVKDGVVSGTDGIWLFLGEILEGYSPIRFQEGEFFVGDPGFAKTPVLRVTAKGAAAYAHYYQRELPTPQQWRLAVKQGAAPPSPESALTNRPSSVLSHKTDRLGIKGLRENVGEWTRDITADKANVFIIGIPPESTDVPVCPLPRKEWEAFKDVGFRTVQPAPER